MGDENVDSSSPERLLRIINKFPDLTVIADHLCGDFFNLLAGTNIYFDTCSSLYFLDGKKATEIICKHGVDKVLFGTDYPMWNHVEELERFLLLELTDY